MLIAAGLATNCGGDASNESTAERGKDGTGADVGRTTASDTNSGEDELASTDEDPLTGTDVGELAGTNEDELAGTGGSGSTTIIVDVDPVISTDEGNGEVVEEAFRCGDLSNDANTVTLSYVAAEPPAASGGTPVDGLYHLTRWELFTGNSGANTGDALTRQETISVTWLGEGRAELDVMLGQPQGELGIVYQWSEVVTFEDSSFTSMPTCRTDSVSIADVAGLYDASEEELVFITQSPDVDGTWVRTYTRQ